MTISDVFRASEADEVYSQYSARVVARVWELSAFGRGGIEKRQFDSLCSMTVWVGSHMAETEA